MMFWWLLVPIAVLLVVIVVTGAIATNQERRAAHGDVPPGPARQGCTCEAEPGELCPEHDATMIW